METNKFLLEVKELSNKERLDRFLVTQFPDFSRAKLQKLITEGAVKVNGNVVTEANYKIKNDDICEIIIPEPKEVAIIANDIPLDIIYEDEDLLVINKPSNMTVHPGAGNYQDTLVNALLAYCKDSLSGINGELRPGIVHRLDKDTSGLLVVAKNDYTHNKLAKQLKDRSLSREYIALSWGMPVPLKGQINTFIERSRKDRTKMAISAASGKEAITNYKVMANYQNIISLIWCKLETGRTHQIRAHMAHINCPIIGDHLYGKIRQGYVNKLPEDIAKAMTGFKRQALHAVKLEFLHPTKKEYMLFESPIADDIQKLISMLDFHDAIDIILNNDYY